VTHRFHPLFGRELEFVKRRRNWDVDRVHVYGDDGELVSLPAEWTDVVAVDPFVVIAAGRCPFRVEGSVDAGRLGERANQPVSRP
jgi:hypothetical protein